MSVIELALGAMVVVMGAVVVWEVLDRVHDTWIADRTERRFNQWHTKGDEPSEGDAA